NVIVSITYTVVILSILAQGYTLKIVLNMIYPHNITKKEANTVDN
ncbi:sodium:proton antiporter, partial [Francisella tularensis subsp. holarctica]|nr:sodium:proton antiporter [Francisella tularensis subsp. holarctica]